MQPWLRYKSIQARSPLLARLRDRTEMAVSRLQNLDPQVEKQASKRMESTRRKAIYNNRSDIEVENLVCFKLWVDSCAPMYVSWQVHKT